MDITITLTVEEVNAILQTLGNLPTHTGAWELLKKIKAQADPQVPVPQEQPVDS
jgi:hypothetical protein